ncbi:MAG TPA: Ig-like domain-containing protein, partial [Saprospiraceae bacterium]|nr:Ig-like domain-containing protein [Saprospiraceae bacterium]
DNDGGLNLMLTDVTGVVGGIVDFNDDGSFTFIPDPGFSGFGSFTYTVTDACGNSATAFVEILVEEPVCDFTAEFINTNASCGFEDGSASVVVDPSGSYFYEWSNGDSGPMITNVGAGIYSVTIEDLNLGCFLEFETEVGENPPVYISNLEVLQPMCPNPGDIRFEVSSSGGGPFEIEVTLPDGTTVTFSVPEGFVSLLEYVPISDGTYTINVFDVNAGPSCTESFEATIMGTTTLEIMVDAIIPPSEPSSMDGAISVLITMPGTPPYTIFLNGEFWGMTSGAFIVEGLGAGDYTIQIQDANGCLSNILEVTVPLPESLGLEVGFGMGTMQSNPIPLPEQPKTAGHTIVSSYVDVRLHYTTGGIKQVNSLVIYREDHGSVYRFSQMVELWEKEYYGIAFKAQGGLSVDFVRNHPAEHYWTIRGSAARRIGKVMTVNAAVSLRGWQRIEKPAIEVGVKMPLMGVFPKMNKD